MTEIHAPAVLTTPAGVVNFNLTIIGSDYFCTDIQGLGGAPLRAPIDEAPQTPGGIVYPFIKGPRYMTVEGLLLPLYGITATNVERLTERNVMEGALDAALQSIEAEDGTWSWTPTGSDTRTLVVRCDVSADFPDKGSVQYGSSMLKGFMFGLVAANPIIA